MITRVQHEETLLALRTFVSKNLDKKINMALLTKELATTEYMLRTVCNVEFHKTVHEFILGERLKKAEHLLLHTNQTITTIASECGMGSTSQFTKAFRKQYGMTPARYRNAR